MSELTDFRQSKDEFLAHEHDSPLTLEQQATFSGLSYFDERSDLRFVLRVQEFDSQDVVQMQTSTGDLASYRRWGKIGFSVEGEEAELTLFKDTDRGEIFLPFADATSGKETYGSGRYLEVQPVSGGKLLVDFNQAYNPYCAYNDRWSCPITPFENRLQVPILAGEKSFK